MDPEVQRMRDELLFTQVKGTRSLNLGLTITYAACVALTGAFAVGIVVLDKGAGPLLMDLGMMASVAACAAHWWGRYKASVAALDEIGDDPTGIDTCKTYSPSTAAIIAGSRKSANELRQQWIAYGIIGILMLLFGVFFVALLSAYGEEVLFLICAGVMLAGGILLSSMAIEAWREWLVASRLEQLEQ